MQSNAVQKLALFIIGNKQEKNLKIYAKRENRQSLV